MLWCCLNCWCTFCCKLQRLFLSVRFKNLVDDYLLQALGTAEHVLNQFPKVMMAFIQGLQRKSLHVHWDKTGFLASSVGLAGQLNAKWSLSAEDRLKGARCLGTDANDGTVRRVGEQDERLAKAKRVSQKVQTLRAAGANVSTIMRGYPTATAVWGECCDGDL